MEYEHKKHPSFSHISIILGKINEAFLHRYDALSAIIHFS